ncbi:hypothetical protein PTKIN_Ptkin05aG0028400 [Pterospermum kingtungense]
MNTSSSIFFTLLLSMFLSSGEAFEASCLPATCGHGHGGLDIRFPFRLKPHQPQHSGVDQRFDLFCNNKNNSTMIHFPSYGDLVVKSISYNTRKLNLADPKTCVHEVFLNLNLSLTPFHYYYVVKNYTYFNCSAPLGTTVTEVPCLSGSQHHVYTSESPVPVSDSCRPIKTVAIPFAYSSYLSDNSFGLGLTWELSEPEDSGLQSKTGRFQLTQTKVLMRGIGGGLVVLAAAATVMISIKKALYSNKVGSHGEELLAQHKSMKHQSLLI